MPWCYFRSISGREYLAGPFPRREQAERLRDVEERSGQFCTAVYWSNPSGRSTAKGRVGEDGCLKLP